MPPPSVLAPTPPRYAVVAKSHLGTSGESPVPPSAKPDGVLVVRMAFIVVVAEAVIVGPGSVRSALAPHQTIGCRVVHPKPILCRL